MLKDRFLPCPASASVCPAAAPVETPPPRRVLLIEDDPETVAVVHEGFRHAGVEAELMVLSSSGEALEYLARLEPLNPLYFPEMIIADLKLPGIDGGTVRDSPALRAIPVLMLCNASCLQKLLADDRLQPNGFIAWPTELNEFFAALAQVARVWFPEVSPAA